MGSALFGAIGFNLLPFFETTERWVADFRIATLTPAEPQHPDILFVGITEDTLAQFPYRTPIDRKFLSDLLRTLDERHVRGILLDVLFDQPTEEDKDDQLKETLRAEKAPLVISYGRDEAGLNESQVEYLDDFVPLELRGWANLVKDGFQGTARWIYEGRNLPDGTHLDGVANRLVEKIGGHRREGRTALAYRGRPDAATPPFKSFPAHMVKVLPAAWFENKIIVVGADESFIDRHRTPFAAATADGREGIIPGALIHAHSVAQLLDGRNSPEVGPGLTVLIIAACALAGMLLGRLEINFIIVAGVGLALIFGLWAVGFLLMAQATILIPLVAPSMALLLAMGLTNAYVGLQDRQQKQFIQGAFSKYLSPTLLEEIVKDPSKLSLDARRREMSFIFTDVAGFTTLSERLEAAELAILLNRYLDGVCKVVFRHGGTVDKFIGDAVFALFNAPRDQPDHAQQAVACARDIDQFAQAFLLEEQERGSFFGLTRIGVHCGIANVGNFGSQERFEYTALGDAVNTAARLEGLNKYFATRICVSGAAALRTQNQAYRPLGEIVLKGKAESIPVFEPISNEEEQSPRIQRYLQAYDMMEADNPDALEAFADLLLDFPDDGPSRLHWERLKEGERGSRVEMHDK